MSIWAKAQQLPQESLKKVQDIYGDHFPIEVRHCLAAWLEKKVWTSRPEDQQALFVDELVQEIRQFAEQIQNHEMFVTKMKLCEAANMLENRFSQNPACLYAYLQRCLSAELEVINTCTLQPPYVEQMQYTETKYGELINGLRTVDHSVKEIANEIRTMQSKTETFHIHYYDCVKHKSHMSFLQQTPQMTTERHELETYLRKEIESLQGKLNGWVLDIRQAQETLVERLKRNIVTIRDLQSQVLEVELIKWKREQQLSNNGVVMTSDLNHIQEWCESLAGLLWQTRQQIAEVLRIYSNSDGMNELKQLLNLNGKEILDDLSKQVTALLSTLVTSTFVIEKQPPQVMKTNTRFTATVRLLVGSQLNVHMTPPEVQVSIISEQQAQLLLKCEGGGGVGRGKAPVECGEILNRTGRMEYSPSTRQLAISFRSMQLRKIKRAEKKGTESVMDEKLTLLFQSQFKLGDGELVFQVWTLSLPVVVIVHGNQEPHGWATVTWDNAFAPQGRVPFIVPDKVVWGLLAETLAIKFSSATGGKLSEENLRFLAEKIFKQPSLSMNAMELNAMPVTWTQFCKDALPDRNFTFWEWFYMVIKVTRDFLRPLWCEGLIVGFIQKSKAEEILSKCPPGTFLLRFSDSELGGITIAWVGEGQEVFSLQPFTARDLVLRSLADRVLDLPQLQYLHPNTRKDDVFAKFYTKPDTSDVQKNGYVKPTLITILPNHMAPLPAYAHSPDSLRNTPSVQSSCYMSSVTPGMDVGYIGDNELFEQIRAFNSDGLDIDEFYSPHSAHSMEN